MVATTGKPGASKYVPAASGWSLSSSTSGPDATGGGVGSGAGGGVGVGRGGVDAEEVVGVSHGSSDALADGSAEGSAVASDDGSADCEADGAGISVGSADGVSVSDGVEHGAPVYRLIRWPIRLTPTIATRMTAAVLSRRSESEIAGTRNQPIAVRCRVRSISVRTASKDRSGSSIGPSTRKAAISRSRSFERVMPVAPRRPQPRERQPRGWP
jgi:hypothetical protein